MPTLLATTYDRAGPAAAAGGGEPAAVEPLAALVERARDGAASPERRADAFAEIVRRYQDLVYGYAFSRLRDRALAEDAAQETFLAAYRALPRLADPEALPGWLRRLARTHALRQTRRARPGGATLP